MAPKELLWAYLLPKDLDGATVCIQTGTTTELNLADFFRANNISYEPVPIETNAEAATALYLAGSLVTFSQQTRSGFGRDNVPHFRRSIMHYVLSA